MTDRELLEAAAKAAGYEGLWDDAWYRMSGGRMKWNPLTDDGDALRLAVKLAIDLFVFSDGRVTATAPLPGGGESRQLEGYHGGDPYAATRRAIVRAAAEIGK